MRQIELSDCPEKLQSFVAETIQKRNDNYSWKTEVTGCEEWISAPYKDKSIIVTTYVVYAECLNAFETFKLRMCTNPEFNYGKEVEHESIIAGDIAGHMRHSKSFMQWFGRDIEEILSKSN